MTRSIMSRFLAIFSSRVVGFLAVLVATPIIVRVLGQAEYGTYAFLLSALGVLMLLVDGGIFDGARKFMAEDRERPWQDHVFAFYLRVALVLIAVVVAVIVLTVELDVLSRYFGPEFEKYFLALAGLIAIRQTSTVVRSALMGLDLEQYSESLEIANKTIFLTVGIGLLLGGYGILGLLGARILGHLVSFLGGTIVLSRHLDLSRLFRPVPDGFPTRRLLQFNAGSFVLFGLYISILHLDILLIQWFHGSAATGVYRAALTLAEFLWFVPRILQMTLLHSTSKLWSDEQHEKISSISTRTTRYTLIFTLLLALGLAALARPFVTTYYGPGFEGAVEPLLILIPGALAFAVARPIFAIGQGNGNLRPLNYATGAAALINLVGNLLLIPTYGIHGAAVATTISYLSMLLFHMWSARKLGLHLTSGLRLRRITLTAVISAIPIFMLADFIQSSLLALLVVPPIGFLVYATTSLLIGVVDREELTAVGKRVKSDPE